MSEIVLIERAVRKIESVLNKALQYDPHTQHELSQLSGTVFSIEITEVNQKIYLSPTVDAIHIKLSNMSDVNVTIKGRPSALLGLILNKRDSVSVFPKEIEIKGDIHLAQRLQAIFTGLQIDWEEYLSEFIGDTAAHKAGNILRDTMTFFKQARKNLMQDMSEYLRFEQEVLPDQLLIDEYIREVDQIRNDVERLKQRIERLNDVTSKAK